MIYKSGGIKTIMIPTMEINVKKTATVIPSNRKYSLHISALVSTRVQLLIRKTGREKSKMTPIDIDLTYNP